MEIGVKNKPDAIIFQSSHVNWLFVPQASQSSPYRRAKSDIWLEISPAFLIPVEWGLV